MTDFNHGAFVKELRLRQGGIPTKLYADLMAALEAGLGKTSPPVVPAPVTIEPAWMAIARKYIGKSEVPGAKHAPFILALWERLRRPYRDDETPWCGGFVGYCMAEAGFEVPAVPERAKAWTDWGKSCAPLLGAIGVFGRDGGGHVDFLAGQSATSWYVLGGNQKNQVNIMPLDKSRLIATRWPSPLGAPLIAPPQMSGGILSRNEA